MKTKLNLSLDDVGKVSGYQSAIRGKIEPILKGSSTIFLKMHDIKAIWEQKHDVLRNVLTPGQFDVYANAKDELKQACGRN